ncbi:g4111 [Coccomyxa elongata]
MVQRQSPAGDAENCTVDTGSNSSDEDDAAYSGYVPLENEEPLHVGCHEGNGEANGASTYAPQSMLDDRTAALLARLAQEARGATCPDTSTASESTRSLVDVGTLAATARALSDGCQPIDFAGWGTSAISRSAPLSSSNSNFPGATTDQRQHSRTLQPLPKVVISTPTTGSSEDADKMTLTEEKRTAILGAMKNFSIGYMPQWATVVPEKAWLGVLRDSHGSASETEPEMKSGPRQLP